MAGESPATESVATWLERLAEVQREAASSATSAASLEQLEELRIRWLGRRGIVTQALSAVGKVPAADRPVLGRAANEARQAVERQLQQRRAELVAQARESQWQAERLDMTMPGRPPVVGHRHPLSLVQERIEDIFIAMGFAIAGGPEVELDYFNFEALNIPAGHPARDMQDSFYIDAQRLLRTHTSPVQIRYMQARAPQLPVRIIAPGRVFRRDDDATHSPVFHQVEGLLVDYGVTMAHLKGTLLAFVQQLFGPDARIRLRPSYFPFTEPSAEVDVSCTVCGGSGCRTCSNSGWLEVLGCGMVHPTVLRNGGYDPERVTGFAFGMGIERMAMLLYGIDDLRLFYQNDVRFLRQFD